jgi:hypothetical protein
MLRDMKYTKTELQTIAANTDAVGFDAFCETNGINNVWDEVTLTNFNDGYYNVQLPEYGLQVVYYDGVLDFIDDV